MCVCEHGYLKEKCIQIETHIYWVSQVAAAIKILPANAGDLGSIVSWEDPLEEGMQPTQVFLPGESHGQRSLVATVHEVANNWIPMSDKHLHIYTTIFCVVINVLLIFSSSYLKSSVTLRPYYVNLFIHFCLSA